MLTPWRLAALAMLAAAAWWRLGFLDLMLYDFDEGIASIYALQLAEKWDFPLKGVKTSYEFYNPPFFIYLISIPWLISRSPVFAVGFLQVLFLGALAILFRGLRRMGWSWGALAVLALGGLGPGALLLTLRLWGCALIPTMSIIALLCALKLVRSPRDRAASLILPLAVCAAQQAHFQGALLAVSAGLALWIAGGRANARWLGAGVAAAALSYLPYLFHLVQTHFSDLSVIVTLATQGGSAARSPHDALWRSVWFSLSDFGGVTAFQQNYARFLGGVACGAIYQYAGAAWLAASGIVAAAGLSMGFIRTGWRGRGGALSATQQIAAVALAWTIVPLAVFGLLRVDVVPGYWLAAMPGPWLLAGALLEMIPDVSAVVRWRARIAAPFLAAGLIGFFSACPFFYLRACFAVMERADPALLVYPTYRDQRDAVWFVCDDSSGKRVLLTQDARKPETGVDYQLLYLIAMREGNALRFTFQPDKPFQQPAAARYLLRTLSRPLPPELLRELALWSQRRFGLIRVYRQEPAEN
ncbi:MAG: hypothetical protein WCK47_09400 [bacterium]|nr:hypothetical protein [Candidatus Sumerlaeota bacterium]